MMTFKYQGGSLDGQEAEIAVVSEAMKKPEGWPCTVYSRKPNGHLGPSAFGLYVFAFDGETVSTTHVPSTRDRAFPAPEPEKSDG